MTNLHDSDDSMTDCRQQQALSMRFVQSPDEKEQSNKKAVGLRKSSKIFFFKNKKKKFFLRRLKTCTTFLYCSGSG